VAGQLTLGEATLAAPNVPTPGWLRGLSAGVLLLLLDVLVVQAIGPLPALALPRHDHLLRGIVGSIGLAVVAAFAIVVCFEVLLANRRRDLRPFGIIRPIRLWSGVGIVAGAYFPVLWAAALITYVLGLSGSNTPNLHHDSSGEKLFLAFLLIVAAPWLEEMSVRGMMFSGLVGRFGFWIAAVVSSVLWALPHVVPGVLIVIGSLGMLLAFLRNWTGSVLPGMLVHGTQNTVVTLFATGAGWYAAPMPFVLVATVAALWWWLPANPARAPSG
jgi:hypothetical protein